MPSNYLAQLNDTTPYSVGGASTVADWGTAVKDQLLGLWFEVISFIPNLVAALVVFFVGWAIAIAIGRLVEKVLVILRINQAFENVKGLREAAARANLKINIPRLLGEIVKWFLIIVTLLAATDILGLDAVAAFLQQVLAYIPNVVVAALILIMAIVLSNFVYRTVAASVSAAGFTSGSAVAAICKWSIIVFAVLTALSQLNVATTVINIVLQALFAMIAVAGGLAFGLGGKDMATKWLEKLESDVKGRNK